MHSKHVGSNATRSSPCLKRVTYGRVAATIDDNRLKASLDQFDDTMATDETSAAWHEHLALDGIICAFTMDRGHTVLASELCGTSKREKHPTPI